jgi:hypothetical protein
MESQLFCVGEGKPRFPVAISFLPRLSLSVRRRTTMKRSILYSLPVILFLALVGPSGFAQDAGLSVTTNKVVVDGAVKANEYSFSKELDSLTLYANRTKDTLSLAVVGDTTGWVSVGLGYLKMDGSTIFMGFVGNDGKVQFKPQVGTGNRHTDAPKNVADTVSSYAIKEANGKTTLEISLNAAAYIKNGQTALELIYAVGEAKSFIPKHSSRGALSLKLN